MILRRYAAVVLLLIFVASPAHAARANLQHAAPAAPDPKRSDRTHQGRRHESLAGDADLELPERRHWTTSDRFARNEASQRVDARSADQVGTAERAPRTVGTVRSRLDAEAVLGPSDRAAGDSADCFSEGLVAGIRGSDYCRCGLCRREGPKRICEKFKGKLNGKIVLTAPMREVTAHFDAQGTRLNEKELLALADAPEPRPGRWPRKLRRNRSSGALQFADAKLRFFQTEGAAVLIDPSRGDGGTIFVQSATVPQPPRDPNATAPTRGTSGLRQERAKGYSATGARDRTLQSHRAHVAGGRTSEDDCRSCGRMAGH